MPYANTTVCHASSSRFVNPQKNGESCGAGCALPLDPGGHFSGLDVTGLLSLDLSAISTHAARYKELVTVFISQSKTSHLDGGAASKPAHGPGGL